MVGFSSWVLRRVGELSDRVMEISEGSENLRQAEIVHSEAVSERESRCG